MSWLEAFVLGLVQGLAEFLPVSSSGHLVIAQEVLGVRAPGVLFEVLLHVATLVSVVWVYRETVGELIVGAARRDRKALRYLGKLAFASIPAALIGFVLDDEIGAAFDSPVVVGAMMLVTALLLWSTRAPLARQLVKRINASRAFEMGLAQAVAILPGISRSGATVTVALWRGVDAEEAARFSFLMSIPVILGAGLLEGAQALSEAPSLPLGPALLAFVTAAVSGLFAIRLFVRMLDRRTFPRFAPYVALVGAAFVLYGFVR